jgi:hypothetical protein
MAELHTRRNADHDVDQVEVDVTYNDVTDQVELFFDRIHHHEDEIAHHNLRLSLEEAHALLLHLTRALGPSK